jgi:hypothetical protein
MNIKLLTISLLLFTLCSNLRISHQLPSPNYLRALFIENASGESATAKAQFESGNSQNYNIPDASEVKVERDVDKGGWTAVDPITNFTVKAAGKEVGLEEPPKGVEIRKYRILPGGELQRAPRED